MGKTILFNGKDHGFTEFFPVLPKPRFTLGKTWVKVKYQPWGQAAKKMKIDTALPRFCWYFVQGTLALLPNVSTLGSTGNPLEAQGFNKICKVTLKVKLLMFFLQKAKFRVIQSLQN